jgi:hypothetical protein
MNPAPPGGIIGLEVEVKGRARVALLVVDKAMYALDRRNRLTAKQVTSRLTHARRYTHARTLRHKHTHPLSNTHTHPLSSTHTPSIFFVVLVIVLVCSMKLFTTGSQHCQQSAVM